VKVAYGTSWSFHLKYTEVRFTFPFLKDDKKVNDVHFYTHKITFLVQSSARTTIKQADSFWILFREKELKST
jgi:hypothetical protein